MEKFLDDNEFLKKVFDAIPSFVFIVDSDVRILHLNSTVTQRLGTSKAYVYRKRGGEVLHCIHATDTDEGCGWSDVCPTCVVRNSVNKAISGKSVYREYTRMELNRNEKNGPTEVHLLVSASPFRYEGGDYAILTLEDVTDLKELKVINKELSDEVARRQEAERKLSVEKELLSTVFRNIEDGVIAIDGEGTVVFMNESAEGFTGWPRQEAKNRPLDDILHLTDGKTGAPYAASRQVIMHGAIAESSRFALLKDRSGAERAVTASGALINDKEGKPVETVVVLHDVTDRLKLEAERIRAKSFNSVGVLAGGIAHDFNNLLGVIMANLSLAKKTLTPEQELYEYLTIAGKACMNARDLTYELLSVAKGGEPVKKKVSIAELLREAEILSISDSRWKKEFLPADDLWAVEVDGNQISQLLNNIIDNAVEAMPDGGTIGITAENVVVTPKDAISVNEGRYVKVSVRDNGNGIPEKYLDRIFDPYFTTKKKGTTRGTGLGLAICYSIVHRHDGYITVESKPGAGATFHIYLPASGTKETGMREPDDRDNAAFAAGKSSVAGK